MLFKLNSNGFHSKDIGFVDDSLKGAKVYAN